MYSLTDNGPVTRTEVLLILQAVRDGKEAALTQVLGEIAEREKMTLGEILAMAKDEFGRTVGHYAAQANTAQARGMFFPLTGHQECAVLG